MAILQFIANFPDVESRGSISKTTPKKLEYAVKPGNPSPFTIYLVEVNYLNAGTTKGEVP